MTVVPTADVVLAVALSRARSRPRAARRDLVAGPNACRAARAHHVAVDHAGSGAAGEPFR